MIRRLKRPTRRQRLEALARFPELRLPVAGLPDADMLETLSQSHVPIPKNETTRSPSPSYLLTERDL